MTTIETRKCQQPEAHSFQGAGSADVRCDQPAHWMIDPQAHDEAEAALYEQLAKAQQRFASAIDQGHHAVRDRCDYSRRSQPWTMSDAQVLSKLGEMADHANPDHALHDGSPINIIRRWQRALQDIEKLQSDIMEAEAVYRAHRWTRFFPCTNADGHIHSTLRGCSTVHWNTPMAWYPSLSGKTVDEAVTELGPALCSVCFAGAPVEHKSKTLGQVARDRTRADREAAKALREKAKAAKTLTDAQQFRGYGDASRGEWVTTVAGCKKALRDMIEFKHYSGPDDHHSWYESSLRAAQQATQVLLEREAANPGTGATQAEIDTILAKAEKRQLAYFK